MKNHQHKIIKKKYEDLLSNFNCIICMELPEIPFTTSCCNAIHCQKCTQRLVSNSCPYCRQTCSWNKNAALHRIIGKFPQPCELCNMETTVREMREHIASFCPMTKIQCRDCEIIIYRKDAMVHKSICVPLVYCRLCNLKVLITEISNHNREKCPHRMVQCNNCKGSYRLSKSHQCPEDILACKKCKALIKRKALFLHNIHDCPESFISCKECDANIKRKDYQMHNQDECIQRIINCTKCSHIYVYSYGHSCPEDTVSCADCGLQFKRKFALEHSQQCTKRSVTCMKCAIKFVLLNGHECSEDVVSCTQCSEQFKRKDIQLHSNYCSKREIQCNYCDSMEHYNGCQKRKKNNDCTIQ